MNQKKKLTRNEKRRSRVGSEGIEEYGDKVACTSSLKY